MTQVHSVEAEQREEVTNLRSRLEASESALQASRLLASSLEADLLRKSDYEEVKKELEVLRSI
uniref:TMF_TATA_bd domain-containing protein n=1 Tax=Mesocestoides corti TaxID=53468 RepID=A0A5K3G377_MESCO